MTSQKCRICNFTGDFAVYHAREMMFGTREEFDYFMCTNCGCLQIKNVPADLNRFYPDNYYSLSNSYNNDGEINVFFSLLLKQRINTALFGRNYKFNSFLKRFIDLPPSVHQYGAMLKKMRIQDFKAKILDVGCGSYSPYLNSLRNMGFENLFGVDPNIDNDIEAKNIKILKKDVLQINGSFDAITLHHSFEHIPEQYETLVKLRELLDDNGVCLIRIPLVSSYVWEKYGVNWVEMDPPRHLYLHSIKSIELLANKAGFDFLEVNYESTEFEFYGSEQYVMDIPLVSENSYWINKNSDLFTVEQINNFRNMAKKVNENKTGGRASIYLIKKSHNIC